MSGVENNNVVVIVRYKGVVRWFRSDRDLWVLDVNKWRNEFIENGFDVPEFNSKFRFGFLLVSENNASDFLLAMSPYEIAEDQLSYEFASRYSSAQSWWDVGDLFPIMFVDFDRRKVAAFYPDGTAMERYIPDGWTGEFVDFLTEYSEDAFPKENKFWIKGGVDLLDMLNKRGRAAS